MALALRFSVLFLLSVALQPAWTAQKELKDLDSCEVLMAGSEEQVYRALFQNYVDNWEDGLGQYRGFMGSAVPQTPMTKVLALEYGLIWWGMKWNFAETIEEAIEHRLKIRALNEAKKTIFTDGFMAGQYFIGKEEELGLTFAKTGKKSQNLPVPPEKVRELIARGAFDIDGEGQVTPVSPEQLARRMSETTLTYHNVADVLPGAFGKNSMTESGWVAFKKHGLFDYAKVKETSEFKRVRLLACQLADRGYTIRFNTDYKMTLDAIKNQPRSERDYEAGKDGKLQAKERKQMPSEYNRYQDKDVYKSTLAALLAGKGYSGGLYNEKNQLKGGEAGFRSHNHHYGDSIHYADDKIEYAKVVTMGMLEVLAANGMPYFDPGMISAYTHSLGADLVPFSEYRQKIKSGPEKRIELPDVWDPRTDEYRQGVFSEIAKRKNQGLGNLRVTRRLPIDDPKGRVAAATQGLERLNLNLVFVSSYEEAAVDAGGREWKDLPIYIQGVPAEALAARGDIFEFLRTNLNDKLEIYFINNARFTDTRRPITLKQLLDVLELKYEAQPPVWTGANSIAVSGWGFAPPPAR